MSIDGPRTAPRGSGPYEARFADTATGETDGLHVTLEDFDGHQHLFGPVVWEPRTDADGMVLPTTGDWALVVRSDQGRWCVLIWTPEDL